MKKALVITIPSIALIALIIISVWALTKSNKGKNKNNTNTNTSTENQPTTSQANTYAATSSSDLKTQIFAENIGQVTRIRITPGNETMLVATLPGDIWAFNKVNGKFVKQETEVYKIETNLKGYPTQNGLTGLTLSADYAKTKEIFLSYTFLNGNNELKNRVGRLTLKKQNGIIIGENFTQIFEGNVNASSAHQVQGGVGVLVKGKSHFLFPIGDAFDATNAHDLTKEAGKLFLIQRDGSDPLGDRPYKSQPKIQAIGVRNAYTIALDAFDQNLRYMLVDTGNNDNDKLIFGKLINTNGKNSKQLDLRWNGIDDVQKIAVRDPNTSGNPNMNLYHWSPTQTPLDIEFISQDVAKNFLTKTKAKSFAADSKANYFLITIFGKTGSTDNTPGKKIMLGKLSNLSTQPTVLFSDLIVRDQAGQGFLGHPTSLAVDQKTNYIYFADIIEGRIYLAKK